MKNLRKLAILLLDDENGINAAAFAELSQELGAAGQHDILAAVGCQDDRYFISEIDAERLLAVV